MLDKLLNISSSEVSKLLDAAPLITILIAGADGHIDQKELDWADKVIHIRSYKSKGELKAYYEQVNEIFDERLQYFLDHLPQGVGPRSTQISTHLEALNPILAKMKPSLGAKFYKSFISLAEHTAKASGGIIGFFNVNKEEAKWLALPMLSPIFVEEGDEEE
ncbi:MAG: hypothetical protein WAU01_17840 [Saprospiraceae bacterium]